ncbi:hypothetical protein BBF93_17385 [Hyphomonas sp. CACIAM 19H1]|uniref:hypothetical protein n=1 Tax=Hyphomonas sp. CACIAM 19H1 TaxID=1873716 RepID=UPI000DED38E9|nr:hypothetical protein [Hyphomonas sp. CACIAM 19H1]AXE65808.1 hypothetical protein BBF93_17385 [Hyphomonas sp. CACIAM 19H1]
MIRKFLTASVLSALTLASAAQEPGPGYKPLIDEYHQTLEYTNKDFTGKDWKACKAVCEADRRCQAFSHFKPNTGGARCILRPGIGGGHTTKAWGTVSGVRETPIPELSPEQAFAKSERAKRSLEEVVDLYAPRMKPRKLTAAEKSEANALLAKIHDDPVWPDVERLMVLAESGDREAMLNLLKAFKGKPDGSQSTGIWFTPWESWYGVPQEGIAARWAAEYWMRHGADTVAMGFLINADSLEAGHVIEYGVEVPRDQKLLGKMWDYYWGKTKKAPKLKISAGKAYQGEAALRTKYDRLVAGRQSGTETHPIVKDWTEAYARRHPEVAGSLAAAKTAEDKRVQDEINRRLAQVALSRENSQRVWDRLSGKSQLTQEERLELEAHVGNLGDDYLESFAARYPISYDSSAKRLCALGNAACEQAKASVAFARQLQEAEYARNAQLNAQASGSSSATSYSLPFVEVRTYDRSGNYVGTQTMTQMQADIIGAR